MPANRSGPEGSGASASAGPPPVAGRRGERHRDEGEPGNSFAGELWALGAIVGYTGANIFGRAGVTDTDPVAAPLLRDLPSFVMGLLLLVRGRHYRQLLPNRREFAGRLLLPFLVSGVASVIGTFAFFFALDLGGVNIAVPVLQTQIIWGALFGWLLLQERVTSRGAFGIAVTLGGLAVLTLGQSRGVPASDDWLWGLLLAAIPALAWGFSGVVWRRGQRLGVERSTGITVHYGISVLVSSGFLLLSGRMDVYAGIDTGDLTALALSGVFGGVIAVYSMFSAMKHLPAANVFVLNGAIPMTSALGGALFLGEYVNAVMWLGIFLASIGVVLFQLTGTARARQPETSGSGGLP
ncbi:MAG TPA: DMT family transporter [Trueperaceae bacterium]